jgi:hypothetical protein
MMRTLVIAVCVVAGLAASPLVAADKWANATAFLKHATPQILPDKSSPIHSIYEVGWPANVVKTDGTWALLSGTPGFQKNPAIGWIRVYDLVNGSNDSTSSKDSQHYTARINESQNYDTRATWYWLRGIYWDTNSETRAAIKDYALAILDLDLDNSSFFSSTHCEVIGHLTRQAFASSATPPEEPTIELSPTDRKALLSDCYRRLGTALATDDPVCNYDCWKECFAHAAKILSADDSGHQPPPLPPRLDYEWGNAYVNALSALIGPGGSLAQACTLPADLDDSKKPTMVPTVFKRACDRLNGAVLRDPQWADPHVALGDLNSLHAFYLASHTDGMAGTASQSDKKSAATTGAAPSPEKKWGLAVDDYREAIQCDSGSNKGYLGRSNALQQLAYLVAKTAVAKIVICDGPPTTGCDPPKPNDKSESTARPSEAPAQAQAPTGKPTTTNPAPQKPPTPCACSCYVKAMKPTKAKCDPLTGQACDPWAPPPEAVICQLALANSQCNPKPSSDVTIAFAKVSTLLAAAAASAQSALNTKDLSDKPSVMQLATTQRDLALLNDASPSVAFQYAANAYNLAANSVEFAAKIEDGDSLQSFANNMETLYECYFCQAYPNEDGCQQNASQPGSPASKSNARQQVVNPPSTGRGSHAGATRNVPVHFYAAPYQFNFSKMPFRPRR